MTLAAVLYLYVQISLEVSRVIRIPIVSPDLPGNLVFAENVPAFLNLKLSGQAEDLDFDVSRYRAALDSESLKIGQSQFNVNVVPEIPEGVSVSYRRRFDLKVEQAFRRELPILPILQITQDEDALVEKVYYLMDPPYIMILGPYATIKKLDRLSTKTVYLRSRKLPAQRQVVLSNLPKQVTFAEKKRTQLLVFPFFEEKKQDYEEVILSSQDIRCINPIANLSMEINEDKEVKIYLNEKGNIPQLWIHCPVFTDSENSILPEGEIRGLPVFIDREFFENLIFLEPQTIDAKFKLINPS